jgi:hypothetical protein
LAGLSVSRWTVFLLRVDGTLELVDHQLSASMYRERMGEAYLPDNRDHTQGSTQDEQSRALPDAALPSAVSEVLPPGGTYWKRSECRYTPHPLPSSKIYGKQRREIAATMAAGNKSKMEQLRRLINQGSQSLKHGWRPVAAVEGHATVSTRNRPPQAAKSTPAWREAPPFMRGQPAQGCSLTRQEPLAIHAPRRK